MGQPLLGVLRQAPQQHVLEGNGNLLQVSRGVLQTIGKGLIKGQGIGQTAGHQPKPQDSQRKHVAGRRQPVPVQDLRRRIRPELQMLRLIVIGRGEGEIGQAEVIPLEQDIEGAEALVHFPLLMGEGQGLTQEFQQVQRLGQAEPLLPDPLGHQALAGKGLLDQVEEFFGLVDVENPQDLGMAQFQSQDRRMFEHVPGSGPLRGVPGQELQGDLSPQEIVLGQPHPAPGFFPELAHDQISLPDHLVGLRMIRTVVGHLEATLAGGIA